MLARFGHNYNRGFEINFIKLLYIQMSHSKAKGTEMINTNKAVLVYFNGTQAGQAANAVTGATFISPTDYLHIRRGYTALSS